MYFDAVLNLKMMPLFNGTPVEVKQWLENTTADLYKLFQVCIGETMQLMTVSEYLSR